MVEVIELVRFSFSEADGTDEESEDGTEQDRNERETRNDAGGHDLDVCEESGRGFGSVSLEGGDDGDKGI